MIVTAAEVLLWVIVGLALVVTAAFVAGRWFFVERYPKITTPTLFIAGNKVLLAPPPAVKDAHDAVGSVEKRFVIASRGQAFEANYGHLDLVLGRTARREIVPLIEGWLAARGEGDS